MGKNLFIAEKPSVAQEFARALKLNARKQDGYMESEDAIVTWCVGHLVTMSYPEAYDEKYKRWTLETLPFLPKEWKYEVIDGVKKQYTIVSGLLNRKDVDCIYVCTDSGREGEYIYRLVEQMAGVKGKQRKRVWIDSQTEEEILRGIREAKDLSEYDHLSDSAYLRAKEDYLMGINFSRLLTLQYGRAVSGFQNTDRTVISVGRVMTCVLGMVVRREREIRSFVKTPFYRVLLVQELAGKRFTGEWRAVEGSAYYQSPLLYKENGFKKEEDAKALIGKLKGIVPQESLVLSVERKKETRYAPLLYNLAELQNECSKRFKISPDETLKLTQELYEKKLVTYPRTDARVLSSAVAKEIGRNLKGLLQYASAASFAQEILAAGSHKGIGKSRYTNDKQITDHYAIIPTGQGLSALRSVSPTGQQVYETIVRRFLSIFYPPAVYQKTALVTQMEKERFFSNFRMLQEEGYLKVTPNTYDSKKKKGEEEEEETGCDKDMQEALKKLRKGMKLPVKDAKLKEGETSPPKRYNSGSMILAMENAGQLIEDEDLRAQIKGSGIGTSATRAEILKKLVNIKYIALNKKTQIITPTLLGENIFDVVNVSIRSLLNPELTASWEKGLTYVANGEITSEEYMGKLEHFVRSRTEQVLGSRQHYAMRPYFDAAASYYKDSGKTSAGKGRKNKKPENKTVKTESQ
ncbi:MAG: type IA DNA topoisomerase [Lachnospiraceae bacterium]|nr:type IA DNA topoisomerase [Lachnospiraceae bacterium]